MRTLVLLLALAVPAVAQNAPGMSTRSLGFHVSGLAGYELDGSARGVQGLDYSAGASVSVSAGVPILHRVILDRSHNLYFGYDLIASQTEGGRVRLHFAPLSDLSGFHADFATFRRADLELPDDRTVDVGTPVDVPLESAGGAPPMLVDTLRFSTPR